ncbi:MAG: hypothetical protein DDT26_01943 [Dehalococcoidia bacterium]|nr:hypothetical protein [Chloroflexota bacterium]
MMTNTPRCYYSIFASHSDNKQFIELEEPTRWGAAKLAADLRADGFVVEVLEQNEVSVGLHVGDYNDHAAKRPEWAQY